MRTALLSRDVFFHLHNRKTLLLAAFLNSGFAMAINVDQGHMQGQETLKGLHPHV